MKKIMFNDKYGLTEAVLEGRKTMTRRVMNPQPSWVSGDGYIFNDSKPPRFKVGEVVAVAQSLRDMGYDPSKKDWSRGIIWGLEKTPGWTNKMFVCASDCVHHIRITNVLLERLQDISDEDCYKEGIYKKTLRPPGDIDYFYHSAPTSKWEVYPSPRDAFAGLIDKVSGEGTWASNPFVFVYEFELVK